MTPEEVSDDGFKKYRHKKATNLGSLPPALVLGGSAHRGHPVHELRPEEHVGVIEHAVLEADHDELRVLEVVLEHLSDVLRVGEVEGGVNLVQDVEGRRLEEEQGEDEGERH